MPKEKFPNLLAADLLAVDTETRDPHLTTEGPGFVRGLAELTGIALSWGPKLEESVYMPIAHEGGGNWDRTKVLDYVGDMMRLNVPKVFANAAYDLEALASVGIEVPGEIYDVQVAEYLLDENRSNKLDLLAERYLGERKLTDKVVRFAMEKFGVAEKEAMGHIWRLAAEDVAPYAALDTSLTYRVHQAQLPLIEAEGLEVAYKLERDLIPIVHRMRMTGVRIDEERLDETEARLKVLGAELLRTLNEVSRCPVDIWSSESVFAAAEKAGCANEVQRTEQDSPSFTAPWLMLQTHPFWVALLEARQVDKMLNTFLAGVRKFLYKGRVHPQWRQVRFENAGTRTGRFSSANPAFQQIPARNPKLAGAARSLVIAEPGHLLGAADFSSQEPRLTVHYAAALRLRGADEAVQAYHDNPRLDVHQQAADLTGLDRGTAKQIRLGLAYGMGPKKFAVNAGSTLTQARVWFAKFHAGVPYIRALSDAAQDASQERGYIKTILGRRRHFNLYGPRKWEAGMRPLPHAEAVKEWGPSVVRYFTYRASNAVVQGSAADMCKQAIVNVYHELSLVPTLSIHDEAIYNLPEDQSPELLAEVRRVMESAIPLCVPCPTDGELGPDLGHMEKVSMEVQ